MHWQVDIPAVSAQVNALKPPQGGPPDPVTKLWPRHLSKEVQQRQEGLSAAQTSHAGSSSRKESLRRRFPEYFSLYGYE